MKIKKFKKLSDEELNYIIDKHYNHWVKFNPLMIKENTINKFINIYSKDELPFGIALYDNNNIMIGFCVFKLENLKKYPQFTPWIDDVMIFEKYRGKGYGKKLINEALEILKLYKYEKVYLWTDQASEFYKKLNFNFVQEIEKNEGGYGELYEKSL